MEVWAYPPSVVVVVVVAAAAAAVGVGVDDYMFQNHPVIRTRLVHLARGTNLRWKCGRTPLPLAPPPAPGPARHRPPKGGRRARITQGTPFMTRGDVKAGQGRSLLISSSLSLTCRSRTTPRNPLAVGDPQPPSLSLFFSLPLFSFSPSLFSSSPSLFCFSVSSLFLPLLFSINLFVSYRLVGRVVTASASRAEDPGFESRLRRDFSGVES